MCQLNNYLHFIVKIVELFTVYSENCRFHWLVNRTRLQINVEPNKIDVKLNGRRLYKWIE
jgi:hypothetical protein